MGAGASASESRDSIRRRTKAAREAEAVAPPAVLEEGRSLEAFLRSQAKLREPRVGIVCLILCARAALSHRVDDLGVLGDVLPIVFDFIKPRARPLQPRRSIYGDRNDARYGIYNGLYNGGPREAPS